MSDLVAFLHDRWEGDRLRGETLQAVARALKMRGLPTASTDLIDETGRRMLREVEAKRRIVESYRELWENAKQLARADRLNHPDDSAVLLTTARNMYAGLEIALRLLALPYAEHEQFQEEWHA